MSIKIIFQLQNKNSEYIINSFIVFKLLFRMKSLICQL
ncbi:hypothetical protein ECP03047772_2024, partial [Escherichia coli P0304777.2]